MNSSPLFNGLEASRRVAVTYSAASRFKEEVSLFQNVAPSRRSSNLALYRNADRSRQFQSTLLWHKKTIHCRMHLEPRRFSSTVVVYGTCPPKTCVSQIRRRVNQN